MNSWANYAVFYHIYPLGCCGAEPQNDFDRPPAHRLGGLHGWIPHLERLGVNAVYFGPLFESTRHGYDTADYTKIDQRLGDNGDFASLCAALHEKNIHVVVDGVFNHVGRDFWAFRDVREKREQSPYRDWFHLRFDGNSAYNDGFFYEGWEGNYDLVRLNLSCPAVRDHLFSAVESWVSEFGIDGLRLDVAYCMDKNFLSELAAFCRSKWPDFWMVGEMIHGDYNTIARPGLLQSATNYECYKGLFSSFNAANLFEIAHAFERQFGGYDWSLYNSLHLYNFVDNHDVPRLASQLVSERHLPLCYAILFAMPGIPAIYYGSEWGIGGEKGHGENADLALRPALGERDIQWNALAQWIAKLAHIRRASPALCEGGYKKVYLTNEQLVFERHRDSERVLLSVNLADRAHTARFTGYQTGLDLISGEELLLANGLEMAPYEARLMRVTAQ